MLLVKAGAAVQDMIDKLIPLLESGDIIIDGGNSEYHDSNVRLFYNNLIRLLSCQENFSGYGTPEKNQFIKEESEIFTILNTEMF